MTALGEHERRLLDQDDEKIRSAHRSAVMQNWTERAPWLLALVAVVGIFVFGIGILYTANQKDPCARCLDNAHSNWNCAGNEYLVDCIESRRNELDQCFTLCPAGTGT